MAKYCETCIAAACDFCKWFESHYDAEGDFTGHGFCRRWQTVTDFDDSCGEFTCHCLKDGDPWYDRPARFNTPRTEPPAGKWIRTTPPDPRCPDPAARS